MKGVRKRRMRKCWRGENIVAKVYQEGLWDCKLRVDWVLL